MAAPAQVVPSNSFKIFPSPNSYFLRPTSPAPLSSLLAQHFIIPPVKCCQQRRTLSLSVFLDTTLYKKSGGEVGPSRTFQTGPTEETLPPIESFQRTLATGRSPSLPFPHSIRPPVPHCGRSLANNYFMTETTPIIRHRLKKLRNKFARSA